MMVNVRQRDGDGMTAGTDSSGVRGDTGEESGVPFDPDATGVIRLPGKQAEDAKGDTAAADAEEDTQPGRLPAKPTEEDSAKPADADSPADDEEAAANATTQLRLPPPPQIKIGHPPTVEDAAEQTTPGAAQKPGAATGPQPVRFEAPKPAGPAAHGPAKPSAPAVPEKKAGSWAAPGGAPQEAAAPPQTTTRAPGATPAQGSAAPPAPTKPPAGPQALAKPPAGPQGPSGPQPAPAKAGGAQTVTLSPQAAPAQATAQATAPARTPAKAPAQMPAGKQGAGGRIAALLQSAPKWLPVLLTVEGLVMYIMALRVSPGPLRGVDPADIDGLGLISALPVSAFAAILIMLVSFFVTVAQSTDRKFLLLFQIACITFALHGAGALVADEPRFPTAYIHAGFVDFIGRTGETAISIDARMGWPGYFALFAFVTKAAGISDLTTILNWTPLLTNLLYLLPFVLILRQVVATTRARWFAALLFVLVQWIGQDYFSPQGFTFALYLAFVAILLRWFGKVEPRTKPVAPKGLRKLLGKLDSMTPGELANTGTYRVDKLLMLLMLLVLFFAATASHQITPFMMLGVVTAFLLFKRTKLTWALPFFLGLVVLAWVSYQTVGFWASQIDAIFGGLGRILTNLQRNTGDRISGSDPMHAMVLKARLGILVVILSLAAAGLFRRLRRGVFDRAALILLCVPVLALGLQSYGGEIGLRIYMFALPGACLLAAYAFFPNLPADSADVREETVPIRKRNVRFNPELTRKLSVVLAAFFAVLFATSFLVARYGNEKFERVTSGEVSAMRYIYDHDKPSARVIYLVPKVGPEITPILPWGEKDLEYINWNLQGQVHKDPTQIADVVKKLKDSDRNTFLMVSTGQVSYLQLNEGYPADWGPRFRAALDTSKDIKKVYANKDAAIYVWGKFVKGTEIPEPRPYASRGEPTSPWTPVGIAALAVTWVTLFAYEVVRLQGPNRAPRARRRLLFVAVPAFAVAVGVIIERFIYIALNN